MFTEQRELRGRNHKLFKDGRKKAFFSSKAVLHFQDYLDSDIYDSEVNFTPKRINDERLDGWVITQADWHYALGRPVDKSTDGWVGFGGRKGAHWFKFRLALCGYLHWPTKDYTDIAGAINYDRANLSQDIKSIDIPNGGSINYLSEVNWNNLWTSPGSGEIYARWRLHGSGLKEDVIVNQQAREYIATNLPPSTPASETYFGFIYQIDISDIPKFIINDIVQDPDGDFNDSEGQIETRDALDRLLGFMPITDVVSTGVAKPVERVRLLKRIYNAGGNHYLLVGARVDQLNNLPAGDLIFDPTWGNTSIQADADDGEDYYGWYINGSGTNLIFCDSTSGQISYTGFSWTMPAIPDGATIDNCFIRAYCDTHNNEMDLAIAFEDADPASNTVWSSSHLLSSASWNWTSSTIVCPDVGDNRYYFGSGDEEEIDIAAGLQSMLDDYEGFASGDRINIGFLPQNVPTTANMAFADYGGGTNLAQLYIAWTESSLDPDNDALAFGEQSPSSGETAISWATWSDGAAGSPTITGDSDWGKLQLAVDEEGRSEVYDLTASQTRTLTLTRDGYGSGSGAVTLQIRGHDSTPFTQDAATPSWETYSAPVQKTWRYIQVRIVE